MPYISKKNFWHKHYIFKKTSVGILNKCYFLLQIQAKYLYFLWKMSYVHKWELSKNEKI